MAACRVVLFGAALLFTTGCSVLSLLPKEKEIVTKREIVSCPMVMPVMICEKAGRFQIPEDEREARLWHLISHQQSSCKDHYIATVHRHAKECRRHERK